MPLGCRAPRCQVGINPASPGNVPARGDGGRMEFGILGPLEVWADGREVSIGGRRPRALLAILLLHPNQVVSSDRLLDELWGEDPPEHGADAVKVVVSR